ncbi:MAG: SIS domain-containing protein [Breznakia sp.]
MKDNLIWSYIDEQPDIIKKLLNVDWTSMCNDIPINGIREILITASGSSLNAAMIIKPYFINNLQIEIQIIDPFDLRFYSNVLKKNKDEVMLIGISQTGKSTGTLDCLKEANTQGITTISLTADATSPIAKESKFHFDILCGEENVGPKTKGVCATTMALHILLMTLTQDADVNKVMEEYRKSAEELPNIIKLVKLWCKKNKSWAKAKGVSVIGFGMNNGTAREGALKILETMQIAVMNYNLEEFMHGPQRTIVKGSKLVLLDTKGNGATFMKNLIDFSRTKTKDLLVVSNRGLGEINCSNYPHTSSWVLLMCVCEVLCSYFPEVNGINPSHPIYGNFATNAGTRIK